MALEHLARSVGDLYAPRAQLAVESGAVGQGERLAEGLGAPLPPQRATHVVDEPRAMAPVRNARTSTSTSAG